VDNSYQDNLCSTFTSSSTHTSSVCSSKSCLKLKHINSHTGMQNVLFNLHTHPLISSCMCTQCTGLSNRSTVFQAFMQAVSFKPLQVSEQEKRRQSACGDSQTTCERHGAHKRSRSPARSGSAQTRSQSPGGRRTKSSKVSKQTMSLLLEPCTCTKFASLIYVHKSNRDKIVYW